MEETAFLVRHRHDEGHCEWEQGVRGIDLEVGQRVRVTTGPLAGLRGVLTAQASDGKWVLDAGEIARGVLICIRGQQLCRD